MKSGGQGLRYLIGRLWHHIGQRRRKQFAITAALMVTSGIVEVFSLGAVVPFIGFLAAPEEALKYDIVRVVQGSLGLADGNLAFFFTVAFVVLGVLSGAFRVILLRLVTRISFSAGSDLSVELYRRTLYQPYSVHIARNTSAILSGLGKVNGAISVLSQCLLLLSALMLLVSITGTLILIDPVIATISFCAFGLSYGLIAYFSRRKLRSNGALIANEQTKVFKSIQEGLGGIRDVLLDGTQKLYCDIYSSSDRPLRRAQGDNVFIAGSPRFLLETLGLVLIALLAFILSARQEGLSESLPTLGALALGAQRLLPVLQQAYSAWATILGSESSLVDTVDLLEQPIKSEMLSAPAPLVFTGEIRFEDVYFHYNTSENWIIHDLNLVIKKGSRVGLVGATGGGKSTILDMLMGLLEPTKGCLRIDGDVITGEGVRRWQRCLAHVPQSIFLTDTSFSENIAFGIPVEQIDHQRVAKAAEQAQIASFIEGTEEGYETKVGERGLRLSGGQRQRIGIARALYKQADVLILDEATSALDNVTEQQLMDIIGTMNPDMTIVLIAHRLSTVRQCDAIVEVVNGAVNAIGTYDELLANSESFQKLVGRAH
jgi:ATP-binding cassette subfamily B protein